MSIYSILFNTGKSIQTACDFSFLSSKQKDRRENKQYIVVDRRAETDRRTTPRFNLDLKISNDISTIKNTYASIPHAKEFIDAVNKRDSFVKQNSVLIEGAASCFPGARTVVSIDNSKKDNNKIKTYGLIGIAAINLQEYLRDLLSIFGKTKSNAEPGFLAKFKFFAGTFLEEPLKKSKIGQYILYNLDTTLSDTNIFKNFMFKNGIKRDSEYFEKEIHYPFGIKETIEREYVNYIKVNENVNPFKYHVGKELCYTLDRIPKISLAIGLFLEIPKIITEIKEKQNYKQIAKSSLNVGSYTIGGAFTSVIFSQIGTAAGMIFCPPLAPVLSSAGSVIGFGLGMYLGNKAAQSLNSQY